MTRRLLMVDDSEVSRGWVSDRVTALPGWEVVCAKHPRCIPETLTSGRFDVALVDLLYLGSPINGLDALLTIREHDRRCHLVVFTQGDPAAIQMLRDAWDAFPLATALSKDTPEKEFTNALKQVAMNGTAPIDPALRTHLPRHRSPGRSLADYGNLVKHLGHAKLWQALIDLETDPTYKELADRMQLSLLTVRNYRSELLEDLKPHKLDHPKMREMQAFAKRCRPLLAPHIRRKLPEGLSPLNPC